MTINVKGSGGTIKFTGLTSGTLRVKAGSGGPGTAENPVVVSTDGTPVFLTLDATVRATARETDRSSAPYYGKYATFVCPPLNVGQVLRIRYGVAVDGAGELDTYMTLFTGATYSGIMSMFVDSNDDGGSGSYSTFANTKIEAMSPSVIPGDSYVLELTTYNEGDTGDVKLIVDVI
jgi:hypothetical protein